MKKIKAVLFFCISPVVIFVSDSRVVSAFQMDRYRVVVKENQVRANAAPGMLPMMIVVSQRLHSTIFFFKIKAKTYFSTGLNI